MSNIDPKKNIAQLIHDFPQLGTVLRGMGIDCGECLASQVDTLLDVVRMYHLDMNQLLAKVRDAEKNSEKG